MKKPDFEPNLSHLESLLRMSKSVVFVSDRSTGKQVRKVCHSLGLPCFFAAKETPHSLLPGQAAHFERDLSNFVTIIETYTLTPEWRTLAEQVFWIANPPITPEAIRVYEQAIAMAPGSVVTHIENWGL
jgi:hypothetical protein